MGSNYVRMISNVAARQQEDLRYLQRQTGLGISELVRRMLDNCLQEDSLNRLVPNMSGQIRVGGK